MKTTGDTIPGDYADGSSYSYSFVINPGEYKIFKKKYFYQYIMKKTLILI